MFKIQHITVDCRDPYALALFWSAVTGWPVSDQDVPGDPEVAVEPAEPGVPELLFVRVPEAKAGKNRLHLDVRAAPGLQGDARMAALEAEAERLVALGATRQKRYDPAPLLDQGHIMMTDPEGNEFCLD